MLHASADLDDEQRAQLAHELPTDLDSSPSSQLSGVPSSTFFSDARRRPKSASRHRSHTTDGSTNSSHLLARLVSTEEEVREINATLLVTSERLETESSRASAAERRALDYFHRLRIATENRERTEQECARLREELKLYKLQLENAQKEIFRAQDIIDQVAAQRNEAEAEAARARTKARKLQEEKLIMLAREEGRRVGYREGLSMGRRIGYDQENYDDQDNVFQLEDLTDEERNDPRSQMLLRSAASIRHPTRPESAPPVRVFEAAPPLPIPSRDDPIPIRPPSYEHRTPSPPRDPDEPETIHPIPVRASPDTAVHHIVAPPDGWIPRSDSRASHLSVPPPREYQQRAPTPPIAIANELQDSRRTPQPEPTPIPPPVRSRDYAYQAPAQPPVQRMHTPSLASRSSTHISQYDLVNKRPGSSLRNEVYLGRAGSGSQHSRASTSRSEYREQDRHRSDRTEAENIVDQWRADSDTATPPRNPPRSHTPSSASHSRRAVQFYSTRPREIVTPTPLGDVAEDPRPQSPDRTPTGTPQPPDEPPSHPARSRSPLEYIRQRFRQRPPSAGSSIPNIVVESPSEPETAISPSATTAAQPELLSPEAANRPLPHDDPSPAAHHAPAQPHHSSASTSTYDRSGAGTPGVPWPAGFVAYPSASTPEPRGAKERERERRRSQPDRERERDAGRAHGHHARATSYAYAPAPPPVQAPQGGYARTRTQSASSSAAGMGMGRRSGVAVTGSGSAGSAGSGGGDMYEAAPLPPGVVYPAPPTRPHTSHVRHRERDRAQDRDRDRDRDRMRDAVRDWERERTRERERPGDRDRRGDSRREERAREWERERERAPPDAGEYDDDEERTAARLSPAALARPISLFDSDEG